LRWALLSGVLFGFGYLVNATIAFFPLLLFLIFWRRQLRRAGVAMLLVSILVMAGWGLRNHLLHLNTSERAEQTLVYGSWPDLYDVYRHRYVDAKAASTMQQINQETAITYADPAQGLRTMLHRMAGDPARYIVWYALQKPFLLWDWNIQLGAGDVNYLDTQRSPLETNPTLRAICVLQRLLNPLLFALALLGIALSLRDERGLPLALFFFYVTAIYTVLQPEPRYSTPFRFAEILLAVAVFAWGQRALNERSTAHAVPQTTENLL
jgi:hypothetical protein